MMMRNIVRFAAMLVAADLYLTSGRFVNTVLKDRLKDVKDQVSVGDEPTALEDGSLDSGMLVAADLYLTSGRFVNTVLKDRLKDVKDQVSVGDEPTALEDGSLDSGMLVAADLYLTSGRFVNTVLKDRLKDVKDQVSVGDELTALEDGSLDSGVIKNIINPLNHLILSRGKRKAITDLSRRWTNNEIPFEIDQSQFNNYEVQLIKEAMNEWERSTCLKFRPRETHDINFVKFIKDKSCYSTHIGMNGGEQQISLPQPCMPRGTILHEIGHAIGFYHEQNRPDRDQFITVLEENIQDNYKFNFHKYWYNEINTYGLPYDYRSIMHYPANGFSKNNEITIRTKDPSFQDIIGHVQELSYYDIQFANLLYNCY